MADKGIGIPPEKLSHIFEDYFRTKEAINHNCASTGIGLAIVKKVAGTYAIRLTFSSEPGKGTTVTAWFPVESGSVDDKY